MNDEQILLANSYIDGDLTADLRVRAEADPEVMAEVAQLRAVRAELRAVDPPSAEARERAIAAAMSEFRSAGSLLAEPSGRAAPPGAGAGAGGPGAAGEVDRAVEAPVVVPLWRRGWVRPALSIAAAVVAVGLFAAVVGQIGADDDDAAEQEVGLDDEALDERETSGDAGDNAPAERAEQAPEDALAFESSAEMLDDSRSESDAGLQPTDGDLAQEPMSDEMSDDSAPDGDDAAAVLTTPATSESLPGRTPELPIVDDVELAAFARAVIADRDARLLPPSPNHACVDIEVVVSNGYIAIDDVSREFLLEISADDRRATARSLDDDDPPCVPLLTVDIDGTGG